MIKIITAFLNIRFLEYFLIDFIIFILNFYINPLDIINIYIIKLLVFLFQILIICLYFNYHYTKSLFIFSIYFYSRSYLLNFFNSKYLLYFKTIAKSMHYHQIHLLYLKNKKYNQILSQNSSIPHTQQNPFTSIKHSIKSISLSILFPICPTPQKPSPSPSNFH